jgi:hypothetical protein
MRVEREHHSLVCVSAEVVCLLCAISSSFFSFSYRSVVVLLMWFIFSKVQQYDVYEEDHDDGIFLGRVSLWPDCCCSIAIRSNCIIIIIDVLCVIWTQLQIFRHGQRSPIYYYNFPTDPVEIITNTSSFPYELGEMTNVC